MTKTRKNFNLYLFQFLLLLPHCARLALSEGRSKANFVKPLNARFRPSFAKPEIEHPPFVFLVGSPKIRPSTCFVSFIRIIRQVVGWLVYVVQNEKVEDFIIVWPSEARRPENTAD